MIVEKVVDPNNEVRKFLDDFLPSIALLIFMAILPYLIKGISERVSFFPEFQLIELKLKFKFRKLVQQNFQLLDFALTKPTHKLFC